jgi:hypothetical protein
MTFATLPDLSTIFLGPGDDWHRFGADSDQSRSDTTTNMDYISQLDNDYPPPDGGGG